MVLASPHVVKRSASDQSSRGRGNRSATESNASFSAASFASASPRSQSSRCDSGNRSATENAMRPRLRFISFSSASPRSQSHDATVEYRSATENAIAPSLRGRLSSHGEVACGRLGGPRPPGRSRQPSAWGTSAVPNGHDWTATSQASLRRVLGPTQDASALNAAFAPIDPCGEAHGEAMLVPCSLDALQHRKLTAAPRAGHARGEKAFFCRYDSFFRAHLVQGSDRGRSGPFSFDYDEFRRCPSALRQSRSASPRPSRIEAKSVGVPHVGS